MRLVFTIHVIITLLIFKPATSQTCDDAVWSASLDRKGWSMCSKINTYLRGFWGMDWLFGRLEVGECCPADDRSYANQPPVCSNANWTLTLDGFKAWMLCPAGYYLNGLRLGRGPPASLSDIEEGQCCRPQNHRNSYEHCYYENATISFDRIGWRGCQKAGYYMTGFYRSRCKKFYCIEKVECCKMEKGITAALPMMKAVNSSYVARKGSNVTLTCRGYLLLQNIVRFGHDSIIFSDVGWTFNGHPITEEDTNKKATEKFQPTRGRNLFHFPLHIANVSEKDVGKYTCWQYIVANLDKRRVANATIDLKLYESDGLRLKNVSVRVVPDAKGNKSVDMSRTGATSSHPQTSTPTRSQTTNFVLQPSPSSNAVNDVGLLKTMLFIALGLLAGLTTMTVLVTLWDRRRCKPPASLKPPTDLDENDFNYDVFVTYSRNDFPWVERELLRLLRENQVKYCVDHLHFELGKAVVQNMVDSVYQSRKVLAVWSESYASSKYCKQELDYAIQRSFQNSDCSVIVIRLDRTGRKQLPKPLRAKTFLDYSDSVERIGWEKRLIAHLKGPDQKKNAITTIV